MSPVSFNQIPSNLRVPGTYVELDNSQALRGLGQQDFRVLMIGQRLPSGSVAEAVPTQVFSKQEAVDYFGRGSNLANMVATYLDNNNFIELICVALDDAGAGVAATGTYTITGTATENGTLSLYIGGVKVEASVSNGDNATTVGDAVAAAINANGDLPLTAANAIGVVTLTARHAGEIGNDIPLMLNFRGSLGGEKTPAGLSVAIAAMSGGTTNPDVNTAITALPSEIYNVWVSPYFDASNLDSMDAEMDSRHGPLSMLEGHYFTASSDTVANLSTLGNSRNNEHVTILDAATGSPTAAYLWAAALAGQVARSVSIDPARPFTSLPLVGVIAPNPENRRTYAEKNTLLFDGIATHRVDRAGEVQIERGITTYQTNSASQPDASYLDSQTLFTLSFMRQTLKSRVTQKYPRHKLADNGTRFGVGQAIVTPNIIKAEIIALAGEWEEAGLLEDMANFKSNLIVERDQNDPNRLNAQIPPDVVNQFRIFAASLMFRL